MRNIGDEVWYCNYSTAPEELVCLECGGTLFVTVRIYDGTEFTIPC